MNVNRAKKTALRALKDRKLSADEQIRDESGVCNPGETIQLEWSPIRPGTLKGHIGPVPVTDDGNGNLVGQLTAKIHYVSGTITLAGSRLSQTPYRLSYRFDSGVPNKLHFRMTITSTTVKSRVRKLRRKFFRWVHEDDQELIYAYAGRDTNKTARKRPARPAPAAR